jgi:molecular chaperone DnaK
VSVVGIDLGTTNTVVGCVRAGKVHVLADEKGVRLLPSVVSFHPNGEVLVGAAAKARRVIDAKNTVYSHKRLIGRSWGSPEIGQARQRFAFELREGPGQGPLVHARDQDYTLPEISAFVLKRARQIAEQALGSPVERAVITVPAHFNELQRASTKVAGRISGLEVLRILNEPTAAALAYGLGRTGNERVAVYDFGGGTFDCTLLDLNGNVFEVLATAGDSFLGGDDVDNFIADRMAESFLKQHRQDATQDPQMYERLKTTAEDIKIALSTAESHTVMLKDFGHGSAGSTLNFRFTLTRKDLEVMLAPLVERTFKVTQDALSLARLSPTSFDKVILVGGSTRMPLVRRRVEAFFGAPPMDRVNPDEVVAIGAAIQAAALTEGIRRRSIPAPPVVPGRSSQHGTQQTTQTSELNPAALKPAFASAPPAFGFAPTAGSQPPQVGFGAAAGGTPTRAASDANDPQTLTQASPQTERGLGFGTIDEPPSLFSTPNANVPSFPSMSSATGQTLGQGMPSPIGDDAAPWRQAEPSPATLVSTTGSSSGASSIEAGFGHVSDVSLIGNPTGADPVTLARSHPFDALPLTNERGGDAAPPPAPSARSDHDALIDREDLPAVVAKAKPARKPGQGGMNASGGPAMLGRPPPVMVPQPFGPMEKVAPPESSPFTRTAAMPSPQRAPGAKAPPSIVKRQPAPNTTPMQTLSGQPLATTSPFGTGSGAEAKPPPPAAGSPVLATEMFGSPAAPEPAAITPPIPPPAPPLQVAPQQEQPAYPRAPSAFPAPPSAYASAPPPLQSHFGSQPPQAFAFGSAPPPGPDAYEAAPYAPYAAAPSGPYAAAPSGAYGSAPPPGTGSSGQSPIVGRSPPSVESSGNGHASGAYDLHSPPAPPPAAGIHYQAPVLVDVTPRGLVVETAGGYTDTIIPRNSKIPCERTRRFATGRDMQTSVRVRVAQGENPAFPQNTYLGEVELSGLRPAARGAVTVAVTFEVDADGTLRVRARDVQTGQEARATLQLVGVADESSVMMMINRFAQQPVVGRSS